MTQMRRRAPDPLAQIHTTTAKKHDIIDGEMIVVETRRGSIKMKAKVTEDIAPQVVSIPHGWAEANANVLTDITARDPISGYPTLKGLLCRIKKAAA
jgi:anaerobic selenocysteine-containing dehydrogenase